jgi:signal transduction histidine kinase
MSLPLKLRHKGWILTTVPMVLGLLFIIILFRLIGDAEREAQSQLHSKLLVAETTNLSNHIVQAGIALVMYKRLRSTEWAHRYDAIVGELPGIFSSMEQLSKDRAQTGAHIKRLELEVAKVVHLMAIVRQPVPAPELTYLDSPAFTPDLHRLFESMMKEIKQVQAEEVEFQNLHKDEMKRAQLKQFLMFGIAANCLLAWGVSSYFSGNVSRRLSVLSSNSRHLARDEPLSAQLTGDDEIAELDRNFHEMATALKLAQKRKQEFLSMISHDLRTPLTSVIGSLELVSFGKCGDISEDALTVLNRALRNTDAMLRLINELLEIDRMESGGFQLDCRLLPVSAIIDQGVDLVRAEATKRKIEITTADTSAQIYGDENLLVRVIGNLLANAVKFSTAGGTVAITVDEAPDWLAVAVTDRGCGIPATHIEKVFDRFQQVNKSDAHEKGGSGLGLAICKAIVQAHRGKIEVKSHVGQGSTFTFRIPYPDAEKQLEKPASGVAQAAESGASS